MAQPTQNPKANIPWGYVVLLGMSAWGWVYSHWRQTPSSPTKRTDAVQTVPTIPLQPPLTFSPPTATVSNVTGYSLGADIPKLMHENRPKEAIAEIDKLIRRSRVTSETGSDPGFTAILYETRGWADLDVGDYAATHSDIKLASELLVGPAHTDPNLVSLATQLYWIELLTAWIIPLRDDMKQGNIPASHYAKWASDIRLLQPESIVDSDALEVGHLFEGMFERLSISNESSESGDRLMRLLAGVLKSDPAEAVGSQIDELTDLSEENRKDWHRIAALSDQLRRRYNSDLYSLLSN